MSPPHLGKKLGYLERRWRSSLSRHQKAVQTFARLAELHPDEFLVDLATSLYDQGVALCNAGRHEEALESLRRSTELFRRVSATAPTASPGPQAVALQSLATLLEALGHAEEAHAVRSEVRSLPAPRAARG